MALLTSVHPTSSSTHQQSDMASKALIVLGLAALLLFSLETATARDLAKKTGTEERARRKKVLNQQKYPGGFGGYHGGGFGGYPGGGYPGGGFDAYCRWGCCHGGVFWRLPLLLPFPWFSW
ncbi:hypothetical protein OPV22_017578 [Ensete ventricosum]|uniref:Glycine-rich protein n=1 Tax=Ensete ventricosum TaxID=4639 RepID=A0AAV8QWN7_ENSVE|nr:hypothetical protein OPV22_017578 [Ensete ventricosum]